MLAPDAGVISARTATVGSLPQNGDELFRLIRGGRLEWRAEVPADDLPKVRPGMPVSLQAAAGEAVPGLVRSVAPSVDPQTRNGLVYVDLPRSTAENEQFLELLGRPGLRIERIVSTGQCSPPGFWYDQADGEWVLVVQGEAVLRFADAPAPLTLKAGDFVDIAPHRKHRVESTLPGRTTIWLAIHYAAD